MASSQAIHFRLHTIIPGKFLIFFLHEERVDFEVLLSCECRVMHVFTCVNLSDKTNMSLYVVVRIYFLLARRGEEVTQCYRLSLSVQLRWMNWKLHIGYWNCYFSSLLFY
eukprot:TRINITY_DN244_c0_g1::TRINITY_DN244_c0_g1_i1::g.1645::m.1645 TRINITY_DN244_c0_g1::TRINITY_DN244_c0_g1_i1::g.1645  ORF type:complete len:110 (-),score=-12.19,DUF4312/PF14189.1/0.039 TRINITY_DN244_c0_g1_i1:87-416(-)